MWRKNASAVLQVKLPTGAGLSYPYRVAVLGTFDLGSLALPP